MIVTDRASDAKAADLVGGAKEMAKDVADTSAAAASALGSRLMEQLDRATTGITQAQKVATDRARRAARMTDAYVKENRWKTLGVVALVGVVIGMWLRSGRSPDRS